MGSSWKSVDRRYSLSESKIKPSSPMVPPVSLADQFAQLRASNGGLRIEEGPREV